MASDIDIKAIEVVEKEERVYLGGVNKQMLLRVSILIILDILLINLAAIASLLLRFDFRVPESYIHSYIQSSPITTIVMLACFALFNLYNSVWRYASIHELLYVIYSSAIGSNMLFIIYKFIYETRFPRSFYLLLPLLTIFMVGGVRFAYRLLRKIKMIHLKYPQQRNRVLIVGGGKAGSLIIKEIYNNPQINKHPVAIVDDDKSKLYRKIHGVPIIGGRNDIHRIVNEKKIDEIIIAMPSVSKEQIKEIANVCKETKCKLKTLPGVYELIDGQVDVKRIRDVQIEDLLGREPIIVNLDEISGYLSNEVVLVTGGGGSIGSELCRQIAAFKPKKLLLLDIYENNAYEVQQELHRKFGEALNLEIIIASVRDRKRIDNIFKIYKPGIVFHAAAHKHVPLMESNPLEAIKNNVFGTLNVAEKAHEYGVKRFVLISTDKAVNPTNIMGATKRIAEILIQALDRRSKTELVAVRFGNVLGSNGSVIPLFKKQIEEGGPVTVTHPDIIRYFMTIPEATQLVIQAGAMAKGGEIFVLDMGEPVRIADLAKDLIKLSGMEPDEDIKIEYTGLRPGEKLYEELLMAEEGLMSTKHSKIFVGRPLNINWDGINKELLVLRTFLELENVDLVDVILQKMVPTYRHAS